MIMNGNTYKATKIKAQDRNEWWKMTSSITDMSHRHNTNDDDSKQVLRLPHMKAYNRTNVYLSVQIFNFECENNGGGGGVRRVSRITL